MAPKDKGSLSSLEIDRDVEYYHLDHDDHWIRDPGYMGEEKSDKLEKEFAMRSGPARGPNELQLQCDLLTGELPSDQDTHS